ncbi:MAG: HAD family phosphatase [Cyclobacteriaceae bacterium]
MDLQNIKTIIFDLGGVIIDLDTTATVKSFAKLSGQPETEMLDVFQHNQLFLDYEKGLISSENFRDELRNLLLVEASDQELDQAWNAMLGAIEQPRLDLMLQLQERYEVMVLSNTNEIHEQAFHRILKEVSGKSHLNAFAHQVCFSHDIGMRKPDAEIYDFVITENGIKPEETLFLDDRLDNLEAAKKNGWQAHQVKFPNEILSLF